MHQFFGFPHVLHVVGGDVRLIAVIQRHATLIHEPRIDRDVPNDNTRTVQSDCVTGGKVSDRYSLVVVPDNTIITPGIIQIVVAGRRLPRLTEDPCDVESSTVVEQDVVEVSVRESLASQRP